LAAAAGWRQWISQPCMESAGTVPRLRTLATTLTLLRISTRTTSVIQRQPLRHFSPTSLRYCHDTHRYIPILAIHTNTYPDTNTIHTAIRTQYVPQYIPQYLPDTWPIHTNTYQYIPIHTSTSLGRRSPRAATSAPARSGLRPGLGCMSPAVGNSLAWLPGHVRARGGGQRAL